MNREIVRKVSTLLRSALFGTSRSPLGVRLRLRRRAVAVPDAICRRRGGTCRHRTALGSQRDTEADGVHSAGATATIPPAALMTKTAFCLAPLGPDTWCDRECQRAGRLGELNAWIDFNGDGTWGGPGEQIATVRSCIGRQHDFV